MGGRLSATELVEWIAYDQMDPIGDDRLDFMLAQCAMYSLAPWSKAKLQMDKFLPKWDPEARAADAENEAFGALSRVLGMPKDING